LPITIEGEDVRSVLEVEVEVEVGCTVEFTHKRSYAGSGPVK
jgi:hypothetical protein